MPETPNFQDEQNKGGHANSGGPRHGPVERRILSGLFILALFYTVYFAKSLLLPIFLSLLLYAVLAPLVGLLNRLKIPDPLGAAAIVALLVGVFGATAYELSGPAADWLNRGPSVLLEANVKLWSLKQTIQEAKKTTERIEKMTELSQGDKSKVVVKGPSLASQLASHAQSILASIAIIVALLYFLLAMGRRTLDRVTDSLDDRDKADRLRRTAVQIREQIASYLGTITIIYICLGGITAFVMAVLKMPNPLLWGAVAGVLNFIPYLGAAVTLGIIGVVSLLTFDSWLRILLPPISFLAITTLEGQIVTPLLLGKRLTLNPIAVFLSILFWWWAWGIAGALLAVPILTTVKVISRNVPSLRALRELLR